jgi:hypothetical protein
MQTVGPDSFSAWIEQNSLIAPAINWRSRGPGPDSLLFCASTRNVEATIGILTHPRMIFTAHTSYTPAMVQISAQSPVIMTEVFLIFQSLKADAK